MQCVLIIPSTGSQETSQTGRKNKAIGESEQEKRLTVQTSRGSESFFPQISTFGSMDGKLTLLLIGCCGKYFYSNFFFLKILYYFVGFSKLKIPTILKHIKAAVILYFSWKGLC